jgi:hypothetical protein
MKPRKLKEPGMTLAFAILSWMITLKALYDQSTPGPGHPMFIIISFLPISIILSLCVWFEMSSTKLDEESKDKD